MGKSALFAAIALLTMGAYYALSTQQSMIRADERLSDQQRELLATNAAEVGFEYAKKVLMKEFISWQTSVDGSYEGAAYKVDVAVSGDTAYVTTIGRLDDAEVKYLAKVVRENVLTWPDKIPSEAQKFMKYALITEGDLRINGNVLLDSKDELDAEGSEGSRLNADIHTNGKMDANGAAANIYGFGTYVMSETVQHEDKIFSPYGNSSGQDVLKKVSHVDIPYQEFDTQAMVDVGGVYHDRAANVDSHFPEETSYQYENVQLLGDYDFTAQEEGLGTRENPYIWHVDGNLEVSGATTMTGYVIFLVDGDVKINGDVASGGNASNGFAGESHVAIYAMGDEPGADGLPRELYSDNKTIAVGGSTSLVSAQIFSRGDLEFHGNPRIVGSVTVGGKATFSGNPTVEYVPPSPALTMNWLPPTSTVKYRLASWQSY